MRSSARSKQYAPDSIKAEASPPPFCLTVTSGSFHERSTGGRDSVEPSRPVRRPAVPGRAVSPRRPALLTKAPLPFHSMRAAARQVEGDERSAKAPGARSPRPTYQPADPQRCQGCARGLRHRDHDLEFLRGEEPAILPTPRVAGPKEARAACHSAIRRHSAVHTRISARAKEPSPKNDTINTRGQIDREWCSDDRPRVSRLASKVRYARTSPGLNGMPPLGLPLGNAVIEDSGTSAVKKLPEMF